ncbi:glycosyltransferase family 4 protein [Ornithinimicrobium panacihumi]|uniref:glycosyltransferase family 4 protein n=1 Tax=Ornithinimicrobium panacihumi TaxID=2008449 RepID=UPI003F8CB68F
MKVLHVIRSDGFAGVERHVASLALGQVEAGHQVTVIGGGQAAMTPVLTGGGVQHVTGETVRETSMQVRRWRQADVIHAHMTAGEVSAVLGRGLSSRPPLVATRHFARPRGTATGTRLISPLIRRCLAAEIAISEYVAEHADTHPTVVYPGVSTVAAPRAPREPVVLVVQRLQPEKETAVALRAFAEAALGDAWRLQVVGRGAERDALAQLARDLGMSDRVDWLGFRDDVGELMQRASVLLAPCRVEGLGLSVLEAMASGLPVLAAASGAYLETVGGAPDAQLFPPGDHRIGGRLLRELATDPGRLKRYGGALQAVQRERFTVEAQVRGTDAIYAKVLA